MKIKFKNEGNKNSLADSVFEIWSWKIIVPGLMIPPHDLKIGTDGVCQTCLQKEKKKKVTVMREKAGSRRRLDAGLEKNAEAGWWSPAWSGRQRAKRVCGPMMERKTRFSKDLVWVGKIIGVFITFYLILKG